MTRAGFLDYDVVRAAGPFGFVAARGGNGIMVSPEELSHAVAAYHGADLAAVGEGGGTVPRPTGHPDRPYNQAHRTVRPEVPHDPLSESDLRGRHLPPAGAG